MYTFGWFQIFRFETTSIWRVLALAALALMVSCVTGLPSLHGQALERVSPTGQISREHYKTWSLFLVCSPDWLAPEKSADLYRLYTKFESFGRTIGDDNLAVWFWKGEKRADDPSLAKNVDVERSARICKVLQLKPSASPYLVVTANYPDESNFPKQFAVFELGKLSPSDISSLLAKLTDQLVLQGRVDPGPETQERLWIRLLEAAQHLIGNFECKWSFKIETGVLSADLHSCPNS